MPGLYIYGAYVTNAAEYGLDNILVHEPVMHNTILEREKKDVGEIHTYDEIWEEILGHQSFERMTYGGFVDYDDSPRRANNGYWFNGFTPKKFEHYLALLLKKNRKIGNEFTFLNAWNEWGEGMYLEPDVQYGYTILEAVRNAVTLEKEKSEKDEIPLQSLDICERRMRDIFYHKKDSIYLHLLDQWMKYREEEKSIVKWLTKRGINSIIIYGYGIFGRHLLTELQTEEFVVSCIIDKEQTTTEDGQAIITPEEELPEADAIIVTAITSFYEIYRYYRDRFEGAVIPFDQIIDEM